MNAPANIDVEEYIARSMAEMRARELGVSKIDDAVLGVLEGSPPIAAHKIETKLGETRDIIAPALRRLVARGDVIMLRNIYHGQRTVKYTCANVDEVSGVSMSADEAALYAVMADGRERTFEDITRKMRKTNEPIKRVLVRLMNMRAIRSYDICGVTAYRANLSTPSGGAKNGVSA